MNPKKQPPHRMPKLERRNAKKNIDYDLDEENGSSLRTKSLDLPLLNNAKTSFRIDGEFDDEVDVICRNLGLSGPDDFAIPEAAWEARKNRSVSDILPRSRLLYPEEYDRAVDCSDEGDVEEAGFSRRGMEEKFGSGVRIRDAEPEFSLLDNSISEMDKKASDLISYRFQERTRSGAEQIAGDGGGKGGGINGPRPPLLKPPPVRMSLRVNDNLTTWDLVRSLSGDADVDEVVRVDEVKSRFSEENKEESPNGYEARVPATSPGEVASSSSYTTSNEDDSPIDRLYEKRSYSGLKGNIIGWTKGKELGRGSFGTVYKAMSDDGYFFAVKEVSLLDQGNNAQQCIQQLEQEIALLRNIEHENIVQYLGTQKEETKLFIFLELVTQGSLASLYQDFRLKDSQVSLYTRQILNGLKYLHDRNVVHRDIKCGNILVDAQGFVKLADFGLAKEITELNGLKSCKGSVFWMAPEVIRQKPYGRAADIWSLGCTVLEMLTGKVPYPDLEWAQACFKIGQGRKPDIPESLSKEARDFIAECIQVDPVNRPTAYELLDHPFLKGNPSRTSSSSDNSLHGRRS